MKGSRFSKPYRVIFVLMLLALVGLALPGRAQAATPFITITAVKAGESVTVHATGLPAGHLFTARMDKSTTVAANGTVVGTNTAGSDGTFDATYPIPAALKTEVVISIRIDADGGWYAYNAFVNQTRTAVPTAVPTTVPTPVATAAPTTTTPAAKMFVEVVAVEKNSRITVSVTHAPVNINFKVRIGPYYTFGRDQVIATTINTGAGGAFLFNVTLPAIVKDVALVTIRLDSLTGFPSIVAYNAFTNENKGTVAVNPTLPAATSTPTSQASCQVLSVTPTLSMAVNTDFDGVWEVKNISTKVWDNHEIDFRYQSGDKFYKYTGIYDLPKLVNPGDTVKLIADMIAPNKAGTYTTTFVLVGDHGVVCSLPLTIIVK